MQVKTTFMEVRDLLNGTYNTMEPPPQQEELPSLMVNQPTSLKQRALSKKKVSTRTIRDHTDAESIEGSFYMPQKSEYKGSQGSPPKSIIKQTRSRISGSPYLNVEQQKLRDKRQNDVAEAEKTYLDEYNDIQNSYKENELDGANPRNIHELDLPDMRQVIEDQEKLYAMQHKLNSKVEDNKRLKDKNQVLKD